MQTFDLPLQEEITSLLKKVKTIAIVGLSPKENRPSNMVARYLLDVGYTIYPVNPGQSQILGETCYPDVAAVPYAVDVVDIFRNSDDVLPVVEQVAKLKQKPRAIWMQQGIVNESAAQLARDHGIFVVMDRCIKIDHINLISR